MILKAKGGVTLHCIRDPDSETCNKSKAVRVPKWSLESP